MTHIALKAFPLSRDGLKIEQISTGDPVDVPDGLVNGLKDEGFIAEPDAVPVFSPTPDGSGVAVVHQDNTQVQSNGDPVGSGVAGEGSEGTGEGNAAAEQPPTGESLVSEGGGGKTDTSEAKAKKGTAAKKDGAE